MKRGLKNNNKLISILSILVIVTVILYFYNPEINSKNNLNNNDQNLKSKSGNIFSNLFGQIFQSPADMNLTNETILINDTNLTNNTLQDFNIKQPLGPLAAVGTPVTACGTLNGPGVYYLANDINNAASDCIWLHGNNIIFDGDGHSINGGGGRIIYFNAVYTGGVDYNNNTIRNINTNGDIGANVWIPGSDYNLIHNITVEYSNFSDATFLGTQNLIVRYNNFQHLNVHAAHDGPDNCATPQTFISPINSKIYGNTIVGAGEFNLFYGAGGCGVLPNTNSLIENNTIINTNPATSTGGGNIDVAAIEGGVSNLIFRNNKLYSMYGPFGMGIRDGIENNLFENNYFWVNYTGYAAVAILSGAPSQGFNQPNNNTFRNNTFVGGQAMGFMMQSQSTNNRFENNIFWGNAVTTVTPTYAGGNANYISNNPNNIFYHNTFISSNPAGSAIRLVNGAGGPTTFNNNIFVNTNSNSILDCNIFSPATDYVGNNNIFYGTSTGTYCSYTGISAWRTATGEDANSLETNPLFAGTNPTPISNDINEAYKFKLQSSSLGCNIGGSYAGAYPCNGPVYSCIDSDSGTYPTINNATQGTVNNGTSTATDSCAGSTLTEYYCSSSSNLPILSTSITCQYGCSAGACLPSVVDTTPPVISNIQNISITTNSVNITWITDEGSSTLVKHGTSPVAYSFVTTGSNGVTLHSIPLTGLSSGTTYYYVVNSSDASGNTAQSIQLSFTTLANIISNITLLNPTPANNSITSNSNVVFNMSISSNATITKAYFKINNNNYSLPDLLSCHFEFDYNCDNSIIGTSTGTVFNVGRFGEGVFIGAGNSLTYPSTNNINQNEGTIMFWLNHTGWATATGYYLLDTYSDTDATGLIIWKPNGVDLMRPVIYTSTGAYSINYVSTTFPSGTWHNLAITYGNGNLSMFIDGLLVNSTAYTGAITIFNPNIYLGSRRTSVLQSSAIFDEFKIFGKKLSQQEINNIYNYESGAYYLKLNNLAAGTYVFNASSEDINNTITLSETRTFTIDKLPSYSNIIQPIQPINYSKKGNYTFNITWTDIGGVSSVWMEHNFNGTLRNVSVTSSIGNQYYLYVRDLPVGNYQYRWYANDSSGNFNRTTIQLFSVDKLIPVCYVDPKPSIIVKWPMQLNVSIMCNLGNEIKPNMFRDDRNSIYRFVQNEIGVNVSLTAGYYSYVGNINESQNYTASILDDVQGVGVAAAANPVYVYLNGQQRNINITTSQTLNATVIGFIGSVYLYRDYNDVTNESGININLPVGFYEYYAEIYTDSQNQENYTAYNQSKFYYVNVTQGDVLGPVISNIANPTTNTYAKNGNYSFNVTATDASGVSQVIFEYNYLGTLKNVTAISLGSNQYSVTLRDIAAGSYSYKWYAYDTNSNLGSTTQQSYSLNQASNTCSLVINPSSNVNYGTLINASGSCTNNIESPINLFRNGINVNSENNNYLLLNAGIYNYVMNISSSQNYTSATSSNTVSVNQALNPVTLTLNGASNNITIRENQTLTAVGSSVSNNIQMFRDGLDVTGQSGNAISLTRGIYQYLVNSTGSLNYLANNSGVIYYVNVTDIFDDNQAPIYSNVLNPSNNVYSKNGNYSFNITWSDSSGISNVWIEHNLNGALTNSTALSSGGYYYFKVSDLGVGSYQYRWYANDASGNSLNVNRTNIITFNLTRASTICSLQALPSVNVIYPSPINVTGSCNNPETNYTLFRNGININIQNGINVFLKSGSYNYTINSVQSMNYSSKMNSFNATVQKASNKVSLAVNGISNNFSTVLGTLLNVQPTADSGTYNVFRNGVDITSTLGTPQNLSLGNYTYFINSPGDENYTSNTTGYYVGVNVIQCSVDCPFALGLGQRVNLISLPLIPIDNSIQTIFASILNNIDRIYSYDSSTQSWLIYNSNPSIPSTLTYLNPYKSYFVITKNVTGLSMIGNSTYANGTSPSMNLNQGWNLVSSFGLIPITFQSQFLNQNITEIWQMNTTMDYSQITDLNTLMQPGNGYWVYKG